MQDRWFLVSTVVRPNLGCAISLGYCVGNSFPMSGYVANKCYWCDRIYSRIKMVLFGGTKVGRNGITLINTILT